MPIMDRVHFKVNGDSYSVGCEVSSSMMLVDYLREVLELHGTKYMCREGGCGACIVAVTKRKGGPVMAVNSCMMPITLCNEWEITTIEHLGNRKKGYHILQKTLAEKNGTQCGYCSPAWIMNMYSFLFSNAKPTKLEIERAFGSNVCRCTGYRPILDAMKTFSKEEQTNTLPDIEELSICRKSGAICKRKCDDEDEWCILNIKDLEEDNFIQIKLNDGKVWYAVKNLNDVFKILNAVGNQDYMLVHGNTAKGVYPILEYPTTLIDITAIKGLKDCKLDQNLIIGAGVTITEFQNLLNTTADTADNFNYLKKIVEHIQFHSHIPVRNQASVGGNLMIKHQHNEFSSDLFLLFEAVGAYVNILSPDKRYNKYSMQKFLKVNMTGKILVHVLLPPLNDKYKLVTFKVIPRFQNGNIVVKAGFLYKLSDNKKVEEARIVYGEWSPKFTRASRTENFLKGKFLFDNAKNTFCRAPGTLEAIAMAELLMERISYELSLDPFEVRFANLDTTKYNDLKKIVKDLKQSASYNERRKKVNSLNSINRWTKRGLRVSILRWTPSGTLRFDINLSICHGDGTVIITHGGVEMGQGINTKSVQICAYYFGIPVEKVQIKANSTTNSPHTFHSGASMTSQNTSIGIRRACLEMLKRLKPIRQKMNNPTWEELIKQAYEDDVNLYVHKYVGIKQTSQNNYDIFGAAIAEVEVDILTGETEILRVDLIQDVGRSVNPEIDIGQVEGAFIMGQGYWTTENLVYDSKTGELLTNRTWFYFVPLASDIPQDFRVNLRKKSYSVDEIMGAKVTGEPPICLSVVISLAIREAIASARQDAGIPTTEWFQIDGPMTIEKIQLASQCKSSDFKLN